MSTTHHTPIPSSPPQAANAATVNAPLGQLDAAIVAIEAGSGAGLTAVTTEVVNARDGWPTLLDHLDAIVLTGNGTNTGLPLTAGSGNALTGTLYLDPGADDDAQLLRVPTTSANNGDLLFNLGAADFTGVRDVIFNLGFNNPTGGGKVDAAIHSWYLQMENDFYTGGKHYVEAFLAMYPATGTGYRPFMLQGTTDAAEMLIGFRASEFYVTPIVGSDHLITVKSAPSTREIIFGPAALVLRPTPNSSSGMVIMGQDAINPVFALETITDTANWSVNVMTVSTRAGAAVFEVYTATKQTTNTGNMSLTSSATSQIPLQVVALTSQTANLIQVYDQPGNTLWALKANGAMTPATLADASAANGTVYYSSTASKLVYKDAGGTVNALY